MNGIHALIIDTPEGSLLLSAMGGYDKKMAVHTLEEGFPQNPTMLVP